MQELYQQSQELNAACKSYAQAEDIETLYQSTVEKLQVILDGLEGFEESVEEQTGSMTVAMW